MRKLMLGVVAFFILTLLPAGLSAQDEIRISSDQVAEYLRNSPEKYATPDSNEWEHRMYRALVKSGDADSAAQSLAQEDGISTAHEKSLISLWLASVEIFRARTVEARQAGRQQVWERGLVIVRASSHHPLVIKVVVRLRMWTGRCPVDDFEALLAGTANVRDAGTVAAQTADCTLWWLALHARFPKDATILTVLSRDSRNLPLSLRLAFFDELARQPHLSQESRVSLTRDYVTAQWAAGLISGGLVILRSASSGDRQMLLNGKPAPDQATDFRLDYVAALFLSGRAAEARREFERLPYTKEFRSLGNCPRAIGRLIPRGQAADRCDATQSEVGRKWTVLEALLNRQKEDPYLLIEGDGFVGSDSALWIETIRQLLIGENYAGVRHDLAEVWVRRGLAPSMPEIADAETRFVGKDLLKVANNYKEKMLAAAVRWNVNLNESPDRRRGAATPPPLPRGFREIPVPETLRTAPGVSEDRTSWPPEMALLPKGFSAVRLERGTPFTIAVSLSQSLDPVGEVSQGGYWVHLSRNNGMSWDSPLYTGLLQYFPYVVRPTSKMPLLSGDRIMLEVAVKELDSSSITYPPVALRSRRQSSDLYIEIPLADLQSDRDGDGLTDIFEEHLLLDADRPDSDGDGIDDGSDWLPNVRNATPSVDNAPIQRVLEHLLKTPEQAIIEPVDRAPEPLIQAKRNALPSTMRPLLVEGPAEDFANLRTTSMVLVYSPADVERLRSHSPDFHALHLSRAVFNRAHDRGYLSWNMGWTGGTLRLIRDKDSWRIEVISQWIT